MAQISWKMAVPIGRGMCPRVAGVTSAATRGVPARVKTTLKKSGPEGTEHVAGQA